MQIFIIILAIFCTTISIYMLGYSKTIILFFGATIILLAINTLTHIH